MSNLLWTIPAFPLVGFAVLLATGRKLGEPLAGWVATCAVTGSFLAVLATFVDMVGKSGEERILTQQLFTWFSVGSFDVSLGLLADPLSVAMCLFVTGVGALIHLYAIGYMRGDEHFSKFFLYLNLFIVAMLMLVLGDNLVVTFLGWEGVGACSYLLISFWFTDEANASAGKKAFVTNRVGDWGFMVGTFLMWTTIGSVNYLDIAEGAHNGAIAASTATALTLLFFVGAAGKSAQLPLFVWLPDAMAGPTPVSALIHAATMVTSGVYLFVRLNPVLHEAGWANDVIAWVGVITALVAATIAISQDDIKKVLAYSTVSQLGYMFLAIGTENYTAAIFHVITHAFFKALLFMGSGSVIDAMQHDQSMRHYGNLRRYLPITSATFIIGWLAIAGVPPFSGFWSKDEILAGAYAQGTPSGYALWIVGLITAVITAFYMTRQVMMTFFGPEKWREPESVEHELVGPDGEVAAADTGETVVHASSAHDDHDDAHGHALTPDHEPSESPWQMTVPLVILSFFAVTAGILNTPFAHSTKFLEKWLEPVIGSHELGLEGIELSALAVIAIAGAAIGIFVGIGVYIRGFGKPDQIELSIFRRGWGIDDAYSAFVDTIGTKMFALATKFDSDIIDGAVNGVGSMVKRSGEGFSELQSGNVRTSLNVVRSGAVALVLYAVLRMGAS